MKTISGALATHYAGAVTTIATCWKVTRADLQVFGFTDHRTDLVFLGVTYRAATGHDATDVESSSDFSVDNLDVTGFLDDDTLTEADLVAGVWDYARVEIFEVNYEDLTMGARQLRSGWLGEVRIQARPRVFIAELRGLAYALQQTIGEVYTASCRADLGDARCTGGTGLIGGVTLASLTATGQAVTSITDRRTFVASGLADGRWKGGKVTFTTGANTGYSMEVKNWTDGTKTIVLSLPLPYPILAADTFTIEPGCLKRVADCVLYNNIVNMRAEPYVPGMDLLTRGSV